MITPKLVAQVAEAASLNPAATFLRTRFPDIHFSECSANDINPRFHPVLEIEQYELYLISGSPGHCPEPPMGYDRPTGNIPAPQG